MENYTPEVARDLSQKLIQDLMDGIRFQNPTQAGQTIGTLIMLATRCLDQIMGPEYASATIIQVAEEMASGEPQKRTKVEIINRSKLN